MNPFLTASRRPRAVLVHTILFGSAVWTAAACSSSSSLPPGSDTASLPPPNVPRDNDGGTPDATSTEDGSTNDARADASDDAQTDATFDDASDGSSEAGQSDGGGPPSGRCVGQSDCNGLGDVRIGCYFNEVPSCSAAQMCQQDIDCSSVDANTICDKPRAGCFTVCIPQCTKDDDCELGKSCNALHHCVDKTCTQTTDCPNANFTCTGTCKRIECTSDSQCAGRCVRETNGVAAFCVEDWGYCAMP